MKPKSGLRFGPVVVAKPRTRAKKPCADCPPAGLCPSCKQRLPDPFTREELRTLAAKATREAHAVQNPLWFRALLRLADAADHLDAMIARSRMQSERIEGLIAEATKGST